MASFNIPVLIQKQDIYEESWNDYYPTHANINKATGKEYFNASTNISSSTFNFEVRYCEKVKDIIFDTEIYRIIYQNKIFDIINVDRIKENDNKVTLVGKFNGNRH
jgi:SPP1 family predicted phage head-tail adaptor